MVFELEQPQAPGYMDFVMGNIFWNIVETDFSKSRDVTDLVFVVIFSIVVILYPIIYF